MRWRIGGMLLWVVAGCGPGASEVGGSGGGGGGGGESEIDPQQWCAQDDGLPEDSVLPGIMRATMGACGHLVVEDAMGEARLLAPDGGSLDALGQADDAVFAPTGHLLAYEIDGAIVMRDVYSGEQVTLPAAEAFGFVPASDPEVGALGWYCESGALYRWTLAETTAVLDSGVVCEDVVGSSGSSWLAAVEGTGDLVVVDVESGEVLSTAINDADLVTGGRWRELEISTDGTVVVHRVVFEEIVEGSDVSEDVAVSNAAVDVVTDERIELDARASVRFAPGFGHAFTARIGENHFVYTPQRVWRDVPGNEGSFFLGQGALALEHEGPPDRFESWALGDGTTAALGTVGSAGGFKVSPEGGAGAVLELVEGCGVRQETGDCRLAITQLHRWTAEDALADTGLTGFLMGLEYVAEDGRVLVSGNLMLEGEVPPLDETPQDAAAVVSPDGTVLASWQGGSAPSFRASVVDEREGELLVLVGPYDARSLYRVPRSGGAEMLLEGGDVWDAGVDARGERAFVLLSRELQLRGL